MHDMNSFAGTMEWAQTQILDNDQFDVAKMTDTNEAPEYLFRGISPSIYRRLIEKGLSVNATDKRNRTVLHAMFDMAKLCPDFYGHVTCRKWPEAREFTAFLIEHGLVANAFGALVESMNDHVTECTVLHDIVTVLRDHVWSALVFGNELAQTPYRRIADAYCARTETASILYEMTNRAFEKVSELVPLIPPLTTIVMDYLSRDSHTFPRKPSPERTGTLLPPTKRPRPEAGVDALVP